MKCICIWIVFTIAVCVNSASAEKVNGMDGLIQKTETTRQNTAVHLNPFSNLGNNIYSSFVGSTSLLHLGGIAATMVMVSEDWDYLIYKRFKGWGKAKPYFLPSLYTGTACWLMISAPLYLFGYFQKNIEAQGAAFSILQSVMISIVYATVVKAITGRPYPDEKWYVDMRHESRVFRFGFLRGGVFYGWPGGHVMITTATMASLMSYYPDKWWIKIAGVLLITYTILGVTVHEGHWMSDNIAGLFMGYAIGSTVGRSFRDMVNKKLGIPSGRVELTPSFSLSSIGVNFSLHY